MTRFYEQDDRSLVVGCLNNSHASWEECYRRFAPLVQKAVQKYGRFLDADSEELVQNVFLNLYTSLKSFDCTHPLSKFIWTVAKRVCIDEYRRRVAGKRLGQVVSVDHHDRFSEGSLVLRGQNDSPEELLQKSQMIDLVKEAFRRLGDKCSELLRLRYLDELPFQEIAEILGRDKKSLAVQVGRCIEELKANFAVLERTGTKQ